MPLLLLLFLSFGSAEAAPDGTSWSPSTYVRAALEASPELAQSRENLVAAQARLDSQFAHTYFPTLSFSASMTPAKLAAGSRFTFEAWRLNANDIDLNPALNWNLFNSWQDARSLKGTSLARDMSREDYASAQQSRVIAALQTYYGLLQAQKLAEVSKQNLQSQHEAYLLTQDRYNHGMKSLSDLLKTETDWRSAELDVATDEAQERLALFRFNSLIKRDEGLPAVLETSLILGTTDIPVLEAGLRAALIDRPEIRKNRMELETADINFRQALQSALPTLALDFGLSHAVAADFMQPTDSFGWRAAVYGFTLRLALPASFNFYSQFKNVRAAQATWRKSRNASEELRRDIREQVYQAHIGLLRAVQSYEISVRKEDISKQNLDIVLEQYSQGSADVIRLSQARLDYVNSQVQRMRAFYDASINRAEYRRAAGERLWP
ncbi:MAG: TolC family protein [Elusimicrobiota bacterium]